MNAPHNFQCYEDAGGRVAHDYWKYLKSCDFTEAARRIGAASHWEIMLPLLETKEDVKAVFLESMFLPPENLSPFVDYETKEGEAILERARERREKARALSDCRLKATGGLLAVRNIREKHVLRTARKLSDAFEAGMVPEGTLNHSKGVLTGYLCECVAAGDWKSLEALSKLLKRGDAPEDARGGELSYEGQAWGAFCLLHLNTRGLPSKRAVREEMALEDHNRADFSKWLNALGLSGLPAE